MPQCGPFAVKFQLREATLDEPRVRLFRALDSCDERDQISLST